jgi:hypothetical protein
MSPRPRRPVGLPLGAGAAFAIGRIGWGLALSILVGLTVAVQADPLLDRLCRPVALPHRRRGAGPDRDLLAAARRLADLTAADWARTRLADAAAGAALLRRAVDQLGVLLDLRAAARALPAPGREQRRTAELDRRVGRRLDALCLLAAECRAFRDGTGAPTAYSCAAVRPGVLPAMPAAPGTFAFPFEQVDDALERAAADVAAYRELVRKA